MYYNGLQNRYLNNYDIKVKKLQDDLFNKNEKYKNE